MSPRSYAAPTPATYEELRIRTVHRELTVKGLEASTHYIERIGNEKELTARYLLGYVVDSFKGELLVPLKDTVNTFKA